MESSRSLVQQRSVIRFFLNEGEKPTNIHARLRNMFGEETLKRTQVYHWISLFKSGRKTVSDLERCGRPTVVSEKNCARDSGHNRRGLCIINLRARQPVVNGWNVGPEERPKYRVNQSIRKVMCMVFWDWYAWDGTLYLILHIPPTLLLQIIIGLAV